MLGGGIESWRILLLTNMVRYDQLDQMPYGNQIEARALNSVGSLGRN
jgi:hypothetical protein